MHNTDIIYTNQIYRYESLTTGQKSHSDKRHIGYNNIATQASEAAFTNMSNMCTYLPTLRNFLMGHSQGKVAAARARLKGPQSEAEGQGGGGVLGKATRPLLTS